MVRLARIRGPDGPNGPEGVDRSYPTEWDFVRRSKCEVRDIVGCIVGISLGHRWDIVVHRGTSLGYRWDIVVNLRCAMAPNTPCAHCCGSGALHGALLLLVSFVVMSVVVFHFISGAPSMAPSVIARGVAWRWR